MTSTRSAPTPTRRPTCRRTPTCEGVDPRPDHLAGGERARLAGGRPVLQLHPVAEDRRHRRPGHRPDGRGPEPLDPGVRAATAGLPARPPAASTSPRCRPCSSSPTPARRSAAPTAWPTRRPRSRADDRRRGRAVPDPGQHSHDPGHDADRRARHSRRRQEDRRGRRGSRRHGASDAEQRANAAETTLSTFRNRPLTLTLTARRLSNALTGMVTGPSRGVVTLTLRVDAEEAAHLGLKSEILSRATRRLSAQGALLISIGPGRAVRMHATPSPRRSSSSSAIRPAPRQ